MTAGTFPALIRCTTEISEVCPTLGNHSCNQTALLLPSFSEELAKSASGKVGQYLWSASKEEEENEESSGLGKSGHGLQSMSHLTLVQIIGAYNYGVLADLLYRDGQKGGAVC